MKPNSKERKTEELPNISKRELLSLVASKLKGRVLFPELVEDARRVVQSLKKTQS